MYGRHKEKNSAEQPAKFWCHLYRSFPVAFCPLSETRLVDHECVTEDGKTICTLHNPTASESLFEICATEQPRTLAICRHIEYLPLFLVSVGPLLILRQGPHPQATPTHISGHLSNVQIPTTATPCSAARRFLHFSLPISPKLIYRIFHATALSIPSTNPRNRNLQSWEV